MLLEYHDKLDIFFDRYIDVARQLNDKNHPLLYSQCQILSALRIELDTFIDTELEFRGLTVETTTVDFNARINSVEDEMSKANAQLQEMEHKATMPQLMAELMAVH